MKDFVDDAEHLDEIKQQVIEHLQGRVATTRNVIQAMFELHYADWLDGDGIIPTCDYEKRNWLAKYLDIPR